MSVVTVPRRGRGPHRRAVGTRRAAGALACVCLCWWGLAAHAIDAHAATTYVGEYVGQYSFSFDQAGLTPGHEYSDQAQENFSWDVRFGGSAGGPDGVRCTACSREHRREWNRPLRSRRPHRRSRNGRLHDHPERLAAAGVAVLRRAGGRRRGHGRRARHHPHLHRGVRAGERGARGRQRLRGPRRHRGLRQLRPVRLRLGVRRLRSSTGLRRSLGDRSEQRAHRLLPTQLPGLRDDDAVLGPNRLLLGAAIAHRHPQRRRRRSAGRVVGQAGAPARAARSCAATPQASPPSRPTLAGR